MSHSLAIQPSHDGETSALILAAFSVASAEDVPQLLLRLQLASLLIELPADRQLSLEQAVGDAALTYLRTANGTLQVQFSLVNRPHQPLFTVTLASQLPQHEKSSPSAGPSEVPALIARQLTANARLDELSVQPEPSGRLTVRLGQALPAPFELPTDEELSRWTQLFRAESLYDAVSIAVRHCRSVAQQLDEARDVLRSTSKEGKLLHSEYHSLLSLVASKSRNLISILEPNGGIIWVNRAFEDATGYPLSEVRGRRAEEFLFGQETDRHTIRAYQQALHDGKEFLGEILLYRRDRSTFWVECNLIPVTDHTGQITCWLSIDVDITKWRQAEEALREAKRLAEESSRMKSEFLANMSHEIRTPMNAIIGMTELALGTNLTSEQREYLTTVQSAAQSLLQLLNDVLDLSKIEAGKMTIDEVDFDIAELIRDTLKALAVKAHEKGLELIAHVPLDLPTAVRGDPIRLRQVLFNLVGNAIKFTDQGEVLVQVEKLDHAAQQDLYHFIVRDTGIGIPSEKLTTIFDAFTQVDSATTRRYGGTGLGLAISANLTRLMGGKIWVESQVGKGSTFHFTVKLAPSSAPVPMPPSASLEQLRGKSVLVVDDNATNRRILDEMLRYWGMTTTLAPSAAEARRIVREVHQAGRNFDVALVDAMMPDEDGLQWIESIRQERPGTISHIFVLSSIDQVSDRAKGRQLGIDDYLTKPISSRELAKALVARLQTDQASSQPAAHEDAGELQKELPRTKPLRVLVVDDHDANRRLAATVLSRRGHTCVEAAGGEEAVALWRREPFDVILMDVRMPGIDGFQATEIIRREEGASGKHIPIIALTAHAMKADQEKCLSFGMDGYLAKPLRPKELVETVEKIASRASEVEQPHPAPPSPPQPPSATTVAAPQEATAVTSASSLGRNTTPESPAPVSHFDFHKALESMDNDVGLLIQQMKFFLKDGPELLQRIRQAIAHRDAKQLQLAAHRLKGLVARYDAQQAAALAAALEDRGQNAQWDEAAGEAQRLAPLVESLLQAVQQYVVSGSPPPA